MFTAKTQRLLAAQNWGSIARVRQREGHAQCHHRPSKRGEATSPALAPTQRVFLPRSRLLGLCERRPKHREAPTRIDRHPDPASYKLVRPHGPQGMEPRKPTSSSPYIDKDRSPGRDNTSSQAPRLGPFTRTGSRKWAHRQEESALPAEGHDPYLRNRVFYQQPSTHHTVAPSIATLTCLLTWVRRFVGPLIGHTVGPQACR